LDTLDAVPKMSAIIYGPLEMDYHADRSHEVANSMTSDSAYAYQPREQLTESQLPYSQPEYSLSTTSESPTWRFDTLSELQTVQSAPASTSDISSLGGTVDRFPQLSPTQSERSSSDHRRRLAPYSEDTPDDRIRGASGRYADRPLSAMSSRRDLRRASMRLVSGGYDDSR
jgi:hypothetical protein